MNDLKNIIDGIDEYGDVILLSKNKIKKAWGILSKIPVLTPLERKLLNNFFSNIKYFLRDSTGLYAYKKILKDLMIHNKEYIFIYILLFIIITYRYSRKFVLFNYDDIYNIFKKSLKNIHYLKNISTNEKINIVASISFLLDFILKVKRSKNKQILKKFIEKMFIDEEESMIKYEDIVKRFKKIKLINPLMDDNIIDKLYSSDEKIKDFIDKLINVNKYNINKKDKTEDKFNFNESLNEENVGIALKAKQIWNQHKQKLKKQGKWKEPKRCSKCGCLASKCGPLEAAHSDYSKPLKVRFLCKSCHGKENKRLSRKRGPRGIYNPSGKYPKKKK